VGLWTHAASGRVYRRECGSLELFVLVQRHPTQHGIETTAVAARARWAAEPLATASSLIAYTVISLAFVAFRFHLAALRAHDLIDDSEKAFLIA